MKLREIFLVALFFCFLAFLYFFPQIPTLSTALIGPPEDNLQQFWYLWHGLEAIFNPEMPFMHTNRIYYPDGIGLYYVSYYYWSFWMAVLLKPFLNYVALYNFLVLHSFVVAGVGAYVLARYLGGDKKTSLVAGFIFAFSPNHLGRSLHHVHVATIYFAPFFFLFFLRSLREKKIRHSVIAGLLLAGWGLCDWAYLVYGIVFLILAMIYFWMKTKKILPREIFSLGVIMISAVVSVLPLALPMGLIGSRGTFKIAYTGHDTYVADLVGFAVPHFKHLLSQWDWIRQINDQMTGTYWEKAVYLGWVPMVFVGLAWKRLKAEERCYLWLAVVAYIFAMGSHAHILGKQLPVILPNRIIEALPFFTNARNPARIMVWVYLFWSLLTAFSVRVLFFDGKWSRFKKITCAAALFFLFLDYYSVADEKTPLVLPPAYSVIVKDEARDFGILELPYEGARYQAYQSIHGIPIVQGYVNRRFETVLADTLPFDIRRLPEQKEILTEKRVKYIVLHKERFDFNASSANDRAYRQKTQQLSDIYGKLYNKIYEDEKATTYRVYL